MNASRTKSRQGHEGCVFCDCLKGEGEYAILEKGRLTATLIAQNQQGDPHLLVIPVSHKKALIDLTDKEAEALVRAVKSASNVINLAYQISDISIWQNSGLKAGQSIDHVHFNVAGKLGEDVFIKKL